MDGTMTKLTRIALASLFATLPLAAAEKILIVADEFPAMESLAAKLKAGVGLESEIVLQTAMPADLSRRPAVIVYIHKTIGEPAELAFIRYAKEGGKLILLHHSISSGKRPNKYWFDFLGIQLPTGDFASGGYKYYEGIEMELVNLAPGDFVTTKGMVYDRKVAYKRSDGDSPEATLPGFELQDTEVYLNHIFTTPKQVLFGLKFHDAKTGKLFMQDRAGWRQRGGKGWVFYFMAGHSVKDFENVSYAQTVVNAVAWKAGRD
jgi:hypothetical protein